jgi:hypothetical protein
MLGHTSACGVSATGPLPNELWARSIGAMLRNDTRNYRLDIVKTAWRTYIHSLSGASLWQQPRAELIRISAASGGAVIPILPANTSATAMPSQVVARRWSLVTEVSKLRRALAGHLIVLGGLAALAKVRSPVISQARGGSSLDISSGGVLKPVTIREGEGIAIVPDDVVFGAYPTTPSGPYNVEVTLRVAATGETYIIQAPDMVYGGTEEPGTVSIVNGSGSGVVLEVLGASIGADAMRGTAPTPGGAGQAETGLYRLRSPYIDPGGRIRDVTIDVVAADSATSLPAGVTALQGAIPYIPSPEATMGMSSGSFNVDLVPTRGGSNDTGGVGRVRRTLPWTTQSLPAVSHADFGVMMAGRGGGRGRPSVPLCLHPGEQLGVGTTIPTAGNYGFNPPANPPTYWSVGDFAVTFQVIPLRGPGQARAA